MKRTPVAVYHEKHAAVSKHKPLPSLGLCVILDLIGYASFAVPFFGEFIDLLWAPLSAIIYWRLFGFRRGFFGGWFSFIEELLPGLDFIPTFTISWALQYFKRNRVSFKPFLR